MKKTQLCSTVLNAWQQDYQLLHDVLNAEQHVLENRDFAKIAQIMHEKNEAIVHINSQKIPPIVDSSGIQLTSLNQFKQHCLATPELVQHWSELMELVEKCCVRNEINARLIELLNISNQRALNLIKGFDPDNNIYNACGNRTAVRHYNNSISA